jgi:hypothetical protein
VDGTVIPDEERCDRGVEGDRPRRRSSPAAHRDLRTRVRAAARRRL